MTKKNYLLTVLGVCCFVFGTGNAQAQAPFEKLAVGVEAGTYGPGIIVATTLSPNFQLRAGIDYFGYTFNANFDINPDGFLESNPAVKDIPLTGSISDPKLKFANFKAIVDYYPVKNGIFSVSAGFYAGSSAFSVSAKIDDYQRITNEYGGPVVFGYEDVFVKPNPDGSFDGKLKLGNAFKPYFGFGLGRTIANNRVGFKFDLGIIYQGNYKFESKLVTASESLSNAGSFIDDSGVPSGLLKIWPIINFSLSYRIF